MSKRRVPDDEILEEYYVDKKWTSHQIAKEFSCSVPCVCRHLRRLGFTRPESGPNSCNRNFNKKQYRQGYPVTFLPDHPRANFIGYVFDHVLTIENELGRCPTRDEPIHHIDFDRTNSKLENLYPCNSHSEHRQIHNSLFEVAKELFQEGIIQFKNGKYVWEMR